MAQAQLLNAMGVKPGYKVAEKEGQTSAIMIFSTYDYEFNLTQTAELKNMI